MEASPRLERFRKTNPCPICGGGDDMPRGKGQRCSGFLSSDGRFAYCTREEHAGQAPLEQTDPPSYRHILQGECRCGATHLPAPPTQEETYDYVDPNGQLLYQVVRQPGKKFLQRRPDGNGGWIWNLKGITPTLYRLPQVLETASVGETIYVVEGEKDVHAIERAGGIATTNSGGAGKWRTEYAQLLQGAKVIIISDLDPLTKTVGGIERPHAEGQRHAIAIADTIPGATILQPLTGKDASDHLNAGHTLNELQPFTYQQPKPEQWWIDAADLLAEPDPGPTPWLIEDLIIDQALIAAVGRWKTTKSYGLLDLCISIATGNPAYGHLEIPNPGPVIFINEESGRTALWRRLDALTRGRAIPPETLRGKLLVAPSARVRLDNEAWQERLLQLADHQPRLILFDPLVRMKAPGRNENDQTEMAELLEFMRTLRDHTGAAICFVHHTGHTSDHMRGSSDLESIWETRLQWEREGQSPLITIRTEHREAEAAEPITYRINWDPTSRSMRFDLQHQDTPDLANRIRTHLQEHHYGTTDDIRKAVNTRKSDVLRTLEQLETEGLLTRGKSGRQDNLGRPLNDNVWKAAWIHEPWSDPNPEQPPIPPPQSDTQTQQTSQTVVVPDPGTTGNNHESGAVVVPEGGLAPLKGATLGTDHTEQPLGNNEEPGIDDDIPF